MDRYRSVISIVDCHPLAARYLWQLVLREAPDVSRPYEVAFIDSADHIAATEPALYLVDLDAPVLPFPAIMRLLRAHRSSAKVLCTGSYEVPELICDMLLTGAHGFVPFDKLEEQLSPAIKAVLAGSLWMPPAALALYEGQAPAWQRAERRALFTDQERSVLELLQERLSNKELGAALKISERTVRFHLTNIFAKLGVDNRHSAVDAARSRYIPRGMARGYVPAGGTANSR